MITIMQGITHHTTSIRVLCDQFGVYVALVLVARYFQANTIVKIITGITTINISNVAIMIKRFSSDAIKPFGSSTAISQPLRSSINPRDSIIKKYDLYLLFIFKEYPIN
jgi:hypothetical protein